MKRAILLGVILLSMSYSEGQNLISLCLNHTESGRNLTFDYTRQIKNKHEIGLGLRFNINSITQPDDQSNIYYRRIFATEWYQYFGIHAYYHRRLFEKWNCFRPYVFYDLQVTKSTTRSSLFTPWAIDSNNNILYRNFVENFGPFVWIDQNIGLGFRITVYKGLDIYENFGLGGTLIIGEEYHIAFKPYVTYELGYLLTLGVSYNLK